MGTVGPVQSAAISYPLVKVRPKLAKGGPSPSTPSCLKRWRTIASGTPSDSGRSSRDWYVFAFGKPRPQDPTRPVVTLKTAWGNIRRKANVQGRWHDNRHTFITGLAESGEAGDETIRDIAGHVSRRMLKHYSHIGMEAKRRAVDSLVSIQRKSIRQSRHPT